MLTFCLKWRRGYTEVKKKKEQNKNYSAIAISIAKKKNQKTKFTLTAFISIYHKILSTAIQSVFQGPRVLKTI